MSTQPTISVLSPLNLNTTQGGMNRQSLNKNFAAKLRQVSSQTARTLQRTAGYMAPIAPGAAILSAGLGNVANNLAADGGGVSNAVMNVGDSDVIGRMGGMQDDMMSRSMQLLEVQQQVQRRSEEFNMRSNVLKTEHDAKKNAISNMR